MIKKKEFDIVKAIKAGDFPPTVCNMCGKSFEFEDFNENFCFDTYAGFGSKYDMNHIQLNLCCDCFDKVMDWVLPQCKHDPLSGASELMSFPPATAEELDELYREQSKEN